MDELHLSIHDIENYLQNDSRAAAKRYFSNNLSIKAQSVQSKLGSPITMG